MRFISNQEVAFRRFGKSLVSSSAHAVPVPDGAATAAVADRAVQIELQSANPTFPDPSRSGTDVVPRRPTILRS